MSGLSGGTYKVGHDQLSDAISVDYCRCYLCRLKRCQSNTIHNVGYDFKNLISKVMSVFGQCNLILTKMRTQFFYL